MHDFLRQKKNKMVKYVYKLKNDIPIASNKTQTTQKE